MSGHLLGVLEPSVDPPWTEWTAWKLEEAGYSAVIQAWYFRHGLCW
jgi:hypothetical protein